MQHENQRIESVSRFFCESAKLLGLLVDLIGIEPMTSSMPWKRAPKLRHRPTRKGQLFYCRSLRPVRQTAEIVAGPACASAIEAQLRPRQAAQ